MQDRLDALHLAPLSLTSALRAGDPANALRIDASDEGDPVDLTCPACGATASVACGRSVDPDYDDAYRRGDQAAMAATRRYPAQAIACPACATEMRPAS